MIFGYFDTYGAGALAAPNAQNPRLWEPNVAAVKGDKDGFGGFFDEGGGNPY